MLQINFDRMNENGNFKEVTDLLKKLGFELDFEDDEIRACVNHKDIRVVKVTCDDVGIILVFYSDKLYFAHYDRVCINCAGINVYLNEQEVPVIEFLAENSKKVAEIYLE